ncbi:hypothetical protein BG004_001331, partial [Podila humilis]
MDISTANTHPKSQAMVHEATATIRPSTPMAIVHTEQLAIAPIVDSQPFPPPTPIKGAKSNIMLGSASTTHPLAMMADNNSLHHFQTDTHSLYTTTTMSPFFGSTAAGPLSAPSSPTFPNTTTTAVSSTLSFVAMNEHNSHLYEPIRRNSAPLLTSDQALHQRIASDEKQLHRQASWSSFTTASNLNQLGNSMGHHERSPYPHLQSFQMQQHALHQAMPSSNSSTCDSPMLEHFLNSEGDNDMGQGNGGKKIKRNNSVCSTTSVSSNGSLSGNSNNKHPCKFPNCGWTFKRYEHLKRHRLVHTKERTFVCDASGCNKTFSRSDNFSAHLRTHSKKGSIRSDDGGQGPDDSSCDTEMSVKQEGQDTCMHSDGLPVANSPPTTVASQRSSPAEEDSKSSLHSDNSTTHVSLASMTKEEPTSSAMLNQSSFSFGVHSLYQLDHQVDQLGNMVPRYLDLKSVAPSDIHKQNGGQLTPCINPNGESPYPSPMPHYEQFSFPSSISTHFMPSMMQPGFGMDQNSLQQAAVQMGQSSALESPASTAYTPSLPSADSTVSPMSADAFHGTTGAGFYGDHDMRGFHMGPTIPSMGSGDLTYHGYTSAMGDHGATMLGHAQHHHQQHHNQHPQHFQHTQQQQQQQHHDLDPQMLQQRPQHPSSLQTMQSHLLTPNSNPANIPFTSNTSGSST